MGGGRIGILHKGGWGFVNSETSWITQGNCLAVGMGKGWVGELGNGWVM